MIDFVGVLLFVCGFIVGLGAVTVIDLHGFFAQFSSYWTEATIRSHKITKPLIWIGIILCIAGGLILYRKENLSGIPLYHAVFALMLVLNGCFLSFVISPKLLKREKTGQAKTILPKNMQWQIRLSFIVSFVGWWSSVLLFVWYITH